MHALQPLSSGGIGRVAATNNDGFSVGDIVSGWFDWANYTTVAQGAGLTKIDNSADLPLSYHLGALGETMVFQQILHLLSLTSSRSCPVKATPCQHSN